MNSGGLVRIHFKSPHAQTGKVVVHTSDGPVTFVDGYAEVPAELGANLCRAPASFEAAAAVPSQTSPEAPGATKTTREPPDSLPSEIVAPEAAQTPSKRTKR